MSPETVHAAIVVAIGSAAMVVFGMWACFRATSINERAAIWTIAALVLVQVGMYGLGKAWVATP